MAAPQTERGFVMIACDLFAALSVADWPKREWTVLAEILLQVYGPQKRREAHVDPRLIEHYSGLSSKNVYRALKSLKACGVIAEGSSGSFRFVKDFESWNYEAIEKATGAPVRTRRLTDGDLRFALSSNDRYGVVAPIKTSKPVGIQPDTDGIQRDTVPDHERYPTGYQISAPTVSNGIPATIGARASEELEIKEPTPQRGVGVDADANEDTLEPFEAGGAPVSPKPLVTAVSNNPDEVELAIAKAERLFPTRDFGTKVSRISGDWPIAWISYGLDVLHGADNQRWTYFLGILRRIAEDGGLKKATAAGRSTPRPSADFVTVPPGWTAHIAGAKKGPK